MSEYCRSGDESKPVVDISKSVTRFGLWQVSEIRAASLSGILLLVAWVVQDVYESADLSLILNLVALVIAAWTFVPSTIRKLRRLKIGVGALMTIAAVGALALGQVKEAALLCFLYAIAEGLEEYSITKTRRGLRALLDLVPPVATILRNGVEEKISPTELVPGDRVLVRPGERFAADCLILTGRTSLDTSALTGESMPIEAGPGAQVYAGTINGTGPIEAEVTTTAENNSLAKIVQIVETEQARKGPSQRLADSIASKLVPGVLVLSVLIVLYGFLVGEPILWFERALVVLVAATPCALAMSVPITVVTAVGAASKLGALVKGGAALETLGKIRTLAFDKTGTLTRNKPTVIEVVAVDSSTKEYVLSLAAGLESRSEHPLAKAVTSAAQDFIEVSDVVSTPGAGIEGKHSGRLARLGKPGWIDAGPLTETIVRMQQMGATAVLVEEAGVVIGAIAVRDELRNEAKDVISHLIADGYRAVMLTGDNVITATALGHAVGITEIHADLRPEDKADIIRALRSSEPTAMVGDGVNDAPALATSNLGIAMGAMGADVAIETADVALMGESLQSLAQVLDHARRTRTIMFQNLSLSLLLIVALIPLAVFGVLGLATVVLMHEVAEIFVIANGLRAGRLLKHR